MPLETRSGYLIGRYISVPREQVEALEAVAAAAWARLEHEDSHQSCEGGSGLGCEEWESLEIDLQEALREAARAGHIPRPSAAADQLHDLRAAFNAMRYAVSRLTLATEVDPDSFREVTRTAGLAKTQVHGAMQREEGRLLRLSTAEAKRESEAAG